MKRLAMGVAAVVGAMAVAASAQVSCVEPSMLESVFVVGVAHRDGSFTDVGTAWTIDGGWLATNAHVAEGLREAATEEGDRLVGRRGVMDRNEVAIGGLVVHPAYSAWNHRLARMFTRAAAQLKSFDVIPVADVALLEVIAGDPGQPLKLADVTDGKHEPCLGQEVVYLGFPAENLSGFTTMHAVPMRVTAKTDFFFQQTSWEDALLLHLTGTVTGGASGSPVLDGDGRVIGVLSAAEHVGSGDGGRVSFGFAYAQRVDLVRELLDGSVEARQAERNREWSRRAGELFLSADTLIDELVYARAQRGGFEPSQIQVVATRQDTLREGQAEKSVRVVLEPGYTYGFMAVSEDATDIDIVVTSSSGEELGSDTALDQYPLVWLGPVASRTEASITIRAAEGLIQPTGVNARVLRYSADLDAAAEVAAGDTIFEQLVTVEQGGAHTLSFTFTLDAGLLYVFKAESDQQRDIDLGLYQGETPVDSDVLLDSYPVVSAVGIAGEVRLDLVLPASSVPGDTVRLSATSQAVEGVAGTAGEEFFRDSYTVETGGGQTRQWMFTLEAGRNYRFRADSREQRDIDMAVYQGATLLGSDLMTDSFPIVDVSGVGGEVRLEVTMPVTMQAGDVIDLVGMIVP